jgi:CheY-like chemotaxis protein
MVILVASSSIYRQSVYREMIEGLGHSVQCVNSAIECVAKMRETKVDLLILEAPLPWGGSEGVLEIIQNEGSWKNLPVVLVAVGVGPINWMQLSRYRIDDFFFRVPTQHDMSRAVNGVASRVGNWSGGPLGQQEAAFA